MVKKFFVELGRTIVRTVIFIYCKIVYRVKIVGTQNVPKEGALLFCGNHRTYLDPPLIVVTAGRHMRFMAKEELRKNPLFAFLGVLFEGIYVKRDEKDITALKEALKTLKNGGCIGIFPEGTRKGMEKNVKAKNGAAFMAIKSKAKVIPIGIHGTFKPFSKVYVNYGQPIDLSQYDKEQLDEATDKIMQDIIMLTKKED